MDGVKRRRVGKGREGEGRRGFEDGEVRVGDMWRGVEY